MAGDLPKVLRSPRQASKIFGLDGSSPPRQKNLFIVNFRKAGDGGAGALWQKDLPFLVRSVDRPSIDPRVEELHQYNKKRLVHTGYKVGPVRIQLYDTADSTAMRMWAEYSKFHFGDFRHGGNLGDFKYDVMTDEFKDSGGGFGYAPHSSSGAGAVENEFNSHFFFEAIQVFQVFGGQYVQFDLINPRITSFSPDELDYSSSEVATISLSVMYEAIIYVNDSIPQSIRSNEFLTAAFQDVTKFEGDVIEVSGAGLLASPSTATSMETATAQSMQWSNSPAAPPELRTYSSGSSTGALASYGSYNFGSIVSPSSSGPSTAGDLSLAALSNPALAAALRLSRTRRSPAETSSTVLSGSAASPTTISQGTYDIAKVAVSAIGSNYGRLDSEHVQDAVVYGIISASEATGTSPREHIFNRSPADVAGISPAVQTKQPAKFRVRHPQDTGPATDISTDAVQNSWSSADGQGIALTKETYGILNAQRSPASQIGINDNSKVSKSISLKPKHPGKPKNV